MTAPQPPDPAQNSQPEDESSKLLRGMGMPVGPGQPGEAERFEQQMVDNLRRRKTSEAFVRKMADREADRQIRELDRQRWQAPATAALADELKLPRESFRHRISGLAGWNHNVLFAGERKAGKTQLLCNLSAALSMSSMAADWPALWAMANMTSVPASPGVIWTPGRFLGASECFMGGNVAYLNAEMDRDDWLDVFRALPRGSYDASRIRPLHCRGVPMPVITSDAARSWFTGWLNRNDIEVLIIDTWGAFLAANGVRKPSDDGEVRPVLEGIDQIKAATGVCSVIIPVHMPHQTGERHLERFKGAGAVGDWADTLWTYIKDPPPEETRYLAAYGRARIDWPETAVMFDRGTGQLSWGATGSRQQTAAGRQRERVLGALRAAGADGMLGEALLDAAGGNRNDARKARGQMLAAGEITEERDGNRHRFRIAYDQPGA